MILNSAIRREFTYTASGVFIALFAILLTTVLIRMLSQAAGGQIPADAVIALIGFGALTHLSVVLTLTIFISVLMVLTRYYRDSEMVIWFSAGVPLTAFIKPVLQFALPAVIVIAALSLFIAPWAYSKNEAYRAQLNARDDTTRIAPGVFRESGNEERVLFVENSNFNDGLLRNVFISGVQKGDAVDVIVADRGYIKTTPNGDRFVVLENGHRYEGKLHTPAYRISDFERYTVLVEQRKEPDLYDRARARPLKQLLDTPDDRNLSELTGRIGMPISALILALLAISLSFVNPRAGRGYNLLFAILLYMTYSNSIGVFQAWVAQGKLHFVPALVLPHLIMLLVLGVLFYKRLSLTPFWHTFARK